MKNFLENNSIQLILRTIVSIVFIFSGVEKISGMNEFAQSIENYKILPIWMINFPAIFLPWLELIVGLLLLFNVWVKANIKIFILLISAFTLAISIAMLRGLDINCGCFGTLHAQKVGLQKIIENIVLLVLGILIMLIQTRQSNSA